MNSTFLINDEKLSNDQLRKLASDYDYEYAVLKAIIEVESTGNGFSDKTGNIIIQFEPAWFKKLKKDWKEDTRNTTWQSNKVSDQTAEWKAFNSAFASDPNAAMKSTSIGMMQIMGFHYSDIGFKTVGGMWDFAKLSEYHQVLLALKWIRTVPELSEALKNKAWQKVAYHYNGSAYKKFNYDAKLLKAYKKAVNELKK